MSWPSVRAPAAKHRTLFRNALGKKPVRLWKKRVCTRPPVCVQAPDTALVGRSQSTSARSLSFPLFPDSPKRHSPGTSPSTLYFYLEFILLFVSAKCGKFMGKPIHFLSPKAAVDWPCKRLIEHCFEFFKQSSFCQKNPFFCQLSPISSYNK